MEKKASLSQSQTGIFAECMQNPDHNLYNIAFLYKLGANVVLEQLREAILNVIEAHPYAYCRIKLNAEGIAEQYIDKSEPFDIKIDKIPDIEKEKSLLTQKMGFDGGKLLFFRLLHDDNGKYMFFQVHHIIFDGASVTTLLNDIDRAYRGEKVEEEEFSALDFAVKEHEQRNGEEWKRDQQWYQEHFICDDVDTVLVPDLEEEEFCSRTVEKVLNVDADAIDKFCNDNAVKQSNFFTSAYALLLSRYTGDDQVLFSTVWHGRNEKRMARSFGMFVNTMPAFYKIEDGMSVADLFKQGTIVNTETRQHTVYSFADFCTEQHVQTHQIFVYQGKLLRDLSLGGEPISTIPMGYNMTNDPIEIELFQEEGNYKMVISYHAHLYSEIFIEQLIQSYENILLQLTEMNRPLSAIELVSEKQRALLDKFNETESPYDDTQTIVSLFETQQKLHPDKTAVVYKDFRMTYKELGELSDRIASCIAAKGLEPRLVHA